MSTIGTYCTATTAPEHHCSVFGTPSWSGLHQDVFTPQLEDDLRSFIECEAERKGNNDKVSGEVGLNRQFFHPSFLKGWPHQLWVRHYLIGVNRAGG